MLYKRYFYSFPVNFYIDRFLKEVNVSELFLKWFYYHYYHRQLFFFSFLLFFGYFLMMSPCLIGTTLKYNAHALMPRPKAKTNTYM